MRVSSIVGHGIDIVSLSRIKNMMSRSGSFTTRFSKRILHENELKVFNAMVRDEGENSAQVRFLAGNWAMKEAIYKTLDASDQTTFEFRHWYKTYDSRGKPVVFSDKYGGSDEEFLLSISHDNDNLVASVIRQKIMELNL